MVRTKIEIRQITGGWLLSIDIAVDQEVVEEKHFATFKEVLDYLSERKERLGQ